MFEPRILLSFQLLLFIAVSNEHFNFPAPRDPSFTYMQVYENDDDIDPHPRTHTKSFNQRRPEVSLKNEPQ